jgi:hypothetical protein
LLLATFVGAFKRDRRPKPVMIWGKPGVGKTFTVYASAKAIAARLGIDKVDVFCVPCSCLEPTDVAGIPTPIEIDGVIRYTSYLPPLWAWMCSKEYEEHERKVQKDPKWTAPPALLFFDDVPAAHFQTQTAFFKGVHEGMWGDLTQRDNVMTVACGNRVEDGAGANDMPTALANRFRHAYAAPTTSDWVSWAGEEESNVHPFVIGYIRQNEDDLNEFDADVASRSEKAFASARTWEDISDLLWEGELDSNGDEVFTKAVMGIIGRGVATKFLAYMRNTNAVVSPAEIVKNPKTARIPSKKNLDALHATISSLEHHIKQHPEHWEAAIRYALRKEMLPDFGLLLAKTAGWVISHKLDAEQRGEAVGSDIFVELFERYEGVLDAVNL